MQYDIKKKIYKKRPQSLASLFRTLQTCRKDQSSKKGRYGFWHDLAESIQEGFEFLAREREDSTIDMLTAHEELRRWYVLNKKKLESLASRDEDHTQRVDHLTQMVRMTEALSRTLVLIRISVV